MKRNALLVACLLVSPLAVARTAAPGPDCLDARAVERVRSVDENTLVVAAANGRFVVAHASGCDADPPAKLVAEAGWVCGAEREFVQNDATLCPVISVSRIDGRVYAGLAAAADRRGGTLNADGSVTLDSVEVTATAKTAPSRGFRGDTDYCFSPQAVRGWQMAGSDITIQTSPRQAGGNRNYRIELSSSCPELDSASGVAFVSGVGIGMICGHPGDHALALGSDTTRGPPQLGRTANARAGRCQIAAVYPAD